MDFDINTVRGLATLIALIAFIAMVIWAYSSKRKQDFDEAAALPFAEPDTNIHSGSDSRSQGATEQKAEMTSSQTEESKNND